MISEHNRNFATIANKTHSLENVKRWWKRTIVRTSCLTSANNSKFEPGGTMIITNERSSAHTCEAGVDRDGLGRWNFITLKGKKDYYTTVISIYRPSKNQETYLRQTAYTAKRRKVLGNEDTPDKLWFLDLKDLILDKRNQGHEIIIAGDFNDDLNNVKSVTRVFMDNMGLTELMITNYGKGPPTHIRGSKTIDGIFASSKIVLHKGRYVTFEHSPSDHRWIEIEITESSLLGTPRNDLCPPLLRKTTSKIPSVKTNFQRLVENQVRRYKIDQQMDTLFRHITDGNNFDSTQASVYEAIEQRMQRAIKYADRRCRRVRRGNVPYSPEQKSLMGTILILRQIKLRMVLKGKPNRPHRRRILRLIKKYKYQGPSVFGSIKEIDKALENAFMEYNSFKKRATSTRWRYLEQMAAELDGKDGKGRQHHYKILLQREVTKEQFKKIRYCEGKNRGGGVDRIQINDENGESIIYDKTTIENEIMRVNKSKLLQAKDTPLRKKEISELLGEQGDFAKWEQVLNGCIPLPQDIDEGLRLWYEYITCFERHTTFDISWTTQEYVESWSKMKEEKITIPGIQVAHIKCLEYTSVAADIISKLALIPLLVGYSPSTWRCGIDSMIPKKQADLRPEKLRLILLMDARFNHNNKLIGKKMMEYGEKYNLLAPEQFGSRKSKSAIEHAINKRLVMDNIRQTGTKAIYVANDAKSCYDRILLMVAYLTMRNFGVPSLAAQSTIDTLLRMKHYVRTSYGDSTTYYGGDNWISKPHGCGQGNGYGPALWACISSPLLHLLRQQGHGTKLKCPISKLVVHIAAFAFVDDVDIIQTENKREGTYDYVNEHSSISELLTDTQSALNQWLSTLKATGGALEPSKTFYTPIIPKWQGSKKSVHKLTQENSLILEDTNGEPILLQQEDPNDSFFTLGIWQSPSGNETKQLEYLLRKIHEWNTNTSTHTLSWVQARIAIRSTIGRTLLYPLTATSFTAAECSKLQRALLKAVLGKMGFVRTMPEIIATAPPRFGGIGILSFELQQLISHVNLLMIHGPDKNSITHKLLKATLETYALEAGLQGDPLSLPCVSYVTNDTWVSQTLQSLKKYDISITSDIEGLQKWCHNDVFHMDRLSLFFSGTTLAVINKVRLYLRVVTLSDIISANGRSYDQDILQGIRGRNNPSPSSNRYHWPQVPQPTTSERDIWTHSIRLAFEISFIADRTRPSIIPEWNQASYTYSCWLYSSSENTIYEYLSLSKWKIWQKKRELLGTQYTRRSHNTYQAIQETTTVPDDVVIISILPHGNDIIYQGNAGIKRNMSSLSSLSTANKDNNSMHIEALHSYFLYHIKLHNGIAISDGSFDKGRMSYAYMVQPSKFNCKKNDVDYEKILWGSGFGYGDSNDSNSYRAELFGILATIQFTNSLCSKAQVTTGSCTIYCDNKGALSAIFGHRRPTPRWSSYDLVRQIRQDIQKSTINWKYRHVKGHQDTNLPFDRLDPIAQGNVLVDHLAAKQYQQPQLPHGRHLWTPAINGQEISGNLETQVLSRIYQPKMEQRWSNLFDIAPHRQHLLDWDLFFHGLNTQRKSVQPFLTKYNARLLPVGTNLKRRRHSDTDSCPCCGKIEDHNHLLVCNHPKMEETFQELYTDISDIVSTGTSTAVAEAVTSLLRYFHKGSSLPPQSEAGHSLYEEQQGLGSRAFFAGLWLTRWRDYQEIHFQEIKSKQSARLWLTHLIHKIQEMPLYMWKTRNTILHQTTDNRIIQEQHRELDLIIDSIYARKPHSRAMAHCDDAYFRKHNSDRVKQMTIRRKTNWITGANLILNKYDQNTTTQSERFMSFFQWDRG